MNKIEVELKDKKDFVNKYNNNRISNELYNYIKEESKLINLKEKININIKTNFKMTDKEKELLALNIKKTSQEELNDMEYIENKILLKELLLLGLGITVIFFFYLLRSNQFISEIILIVGWLIIWEALDRLLFTRTKNKLAIKRLKQIIKSDIDYID